MVAKSTALIAQVDKDELRDRLEHYSTPEPNSGCTLWVATTNTHGYGSVYAGSGTGTMIGAHRAAYELAYGPIPDGLCIDHLCRQRCCINPKHLEAVTNQENCARGDCGKTRGEQLRTRTHCKNGHRLSGRNVRIGTKGQRVCRACHREWGAKYRHQKRMNRET